MKLRFPWAILVSLSALGTLGGANASAAIFSDDFSAGASGLWQPHPSAASWQATGGVYRGTPAGANTHSSLPFDAADLTIDVDIANVADGGIWLHSRNAPGGGTIGLEGVLFVVRSGDAYWHTATGGDWGPISGMVGHAGVTHVRIVVEDDLYSAYFNGAATAATTLQTSAFPSGRVAVYSNNASQSFDNVILDGTLVPEPGVLALMALGCAAISFPRYRRRSR